MVGYMAPYMEPPISPVGRAPSAPAPLVESIMLDGEVGGSIYGTKYPTTSGSKSGAKIDNLSGRIIEPLRVSSHGAV